MIIVAQPKSCSTSFTAALIALCGFGMRRVRDLLSFQFTRFPRPAGWEEFPHFCARKYPLKWLRFARDYNSWICLHIPPVESNLENLSKLDRLVVLLRDPEDSFDAYIRWCLVREVPIESPEIVKRLHREFNHGWTEFLATNSQFLSVQFEDVLDDPRRSVNRVLAYYGLPELAGEGFRLPRYNFTGYAVNKKNNA